MSDRIIVMNAGEIMQQGTPEQIYHRPENRFVANFMGTYNFVPGELVDLSVSEGEVCIRPEHILMVKKEQLDQFGAANYVRLLGIMKSHYILGNAVRAEVLVGERKLLVDCLNTFQGFDFAANEEVGLVIPKDACMVLSSGVMA